MRSVLFEAALLEPSWIYLSIFVGFLSGGHAARRFFLEALPSKVRTATMETYDCDELQTFAVVPALETSFVRVCFEINARRQRGEVEPISVCHLSFS